MNDHYAKIKCPECKKLFTPALEHAYLIGDEFRGKPVCSYSCQRNYEKRKKLRRMGEDRNIRRVCRELGCEE